ncbi:MAG: hypothetical protein H8E82_02425 [Candidatus Marinimicrobia bacterium]|nr:hypothetical protein [Candidatus Neomarinimicrobiota bacterium]MBL7047325.1 hypothetical protein [Candidatus Neomarinimicrobiota bacterium]
MLQSKSKSIIIIVSTLILGVIIGLTSARFLVHNRIERLAEMSHLEGFVNVMENIIKPSEDQAEEIREILTNHHKRISEMREQHIVEIQIVMDSLKTDLKPYLTDRQLEQIEKMRSRNTKFGKPHFDEQ